MLKLAETVGLTKTVVINNPKLINRGLAQLVARTVRDREAAGSNPVSPTTTGKPDKIKCYTLCMIINKGMNFIAKVRPLKQLKELGKIEGKYKITGYDDNEREAHALQSKEEILNAFAKYSGDNREALESILKKFPYITDPYNIYLNLKEIEARTKKNVFLALSMWDFNGCLSQDRDGYSRTETFVPVLKEVISEQIKRLGSFVVVSASTSEQMAYHMKKEKDIAKNIIIAAMVDNTTDARINPNISSWNNNNNTINDIIPVKIYHNPFSIFFLSLYFCYDILLYKYFENGEGVNRTPYLSVFSRALSQ